MNQQHVPRWVQHVTVAAVSLVAAVAAVASYVHTHELALRAGEGWRATLIPLSVDGMLVAASMVMLVRRREGLRAGALPWAGLVLGIVASLAANVAAGHPEWNPPWLAGVVAAWPPIALAVSFELLILVHRDRPPPAALPAGEEPGDERVTSLIAAGVGRRRLARELAISEHEARELLARARNGHDG